MAYGLSEVLRTEVGEERTMLHEQRTTTLDAVGGG